LYESLKQIKKYTYLFLDSSTVFGFVVKNDLQNDIKSSIFLIKQREDNFIYKAKGLNLHLTANQNTCYT